MKGQTHLSLGLHCGTCLNSGKRLLNPHIPEGPGIPRELPLQSREGHWMLSWLQRTPEFCPQDRNTHRAKREAWGATLSTANTIQNWNNYSGPDSNQNSIIKGLHTTKTFQRSILSQTSFHSYQIPAPEL